jgi:4-amino-4-deoxy-L-arabinose transferase-like glycosyltransferase
VLGVVAGLAGLTKVIGLLLIPIGILAVWLPAAGDRRLRLAAAASSGLFVVVALALVGPWLVRNQIVYGDPIGQKAFMRFFGDRNVTPSALLAVGWTPGEYVWKVTNYSLKSMLGVFGHMDRWLPGWVYGVFGVVSVVGVAGIVVWYVRDKSGVDAGVLRALALWAGAFLLVFLFFVKFNTEFFQAQARYMFPALVPIVAGIVLGATRLVPERGRSGAAWAIAAALFAASLGTLLEYASLAQHM